MPSSLNDKLSLWWARSVNWLRGLVKPRNYLETVAAEAAAVAAATIATATATVVATVAAEATTVATAVAIATTVAAEAATTATVAATVTKAATAATIATATTAVATTATAIAKAATTATVAATATAIVTTAARTAVLVQAHGDERSDNLIEGSHQLGGLLVRKLGQELLLLVGKLGQALGSILGSEDDDLTHIALGIVDATDQVGSLGLGHQTIELTKAHAQQVGHLLLLHLGLEVKELDGALDVRHALGLGLLLLGNSKATAAQQAGGLLHLVHQLFVIVISGGLDNLGLLLGGNLVSSLNLGSFGLHGLDCLNLGSHGLVLGLVHDLFVLRHETPSWPSRASSPHSRGPSRTLCAYKSCLSAKRPLVYGVVRQSSCRIYVHTLMRHVAVSWLKSNAHHKEPAMIKPIMKSEFFLRLPSEDAGPEDAATGQDLLDTLHEHEHECVGLAANMIGVRKRIICVKDGSKSLLMYNPQILEQVNAYQTSEGCLSLVGERPCTRYRRIKVEYLDENFVHRIKNFSGYTAEIIQHEIDHCNGVVI